MTRKQRRSKPKHHSNESRVPKHGQSWLRIIGGQMRGRKLVYTGDPGVRPMKERIREAVFNLVGPRIAGKHAFDLFAGTGALGLESISRGASRATMIERHYPTARVVRDNIKALGVEASAEVVSGDTFVWASQLPDMGPTPWAVFCSPPYRLYQDQRKELLDMIAKLFSVAPAGSLFVVESDATFDFTDLPHGDQWDVRQYPPAVVGLISLPDADD